MPGSSAGRGRRGRRGRLFACGDMVCSPGCAGLLGVMLCPYVGGRTAGRKVNLAQRKKEQVDFV